jgi:hypothetical protein
VLRRIYGRKRDEMTKWWRKLDDFYTSPNIKTMIKSRRMRWECHVARMGKDERIYVIVQKDRRNH